MFLPLPRQNLNFPFFPVFFCECVVCVPQFRIRSFSHNFWEYKKYTCQISTSGSGDFFSFFLFSRKEVRRGPAIGFFGFAWLRSWSQCRSSSPLPPASNKTCFWLLDGPRGLGMGGSSLLPFLYFTFPLLLLIAFWIFMGKFQLIYRRRILISFLLLVDMQPTNAGFFFSPAIHFPFYFLPSFLSLSPHRESHSDMQTPLPTSSWEGEVFACRSGFPRKRKFLCGRGRETMAKK